MSAEKKPGCDDRMTRRVAERPLAASLANGTMRRYGDRPNERLRLRQAKLD